MGKVQLYIQRSFGHEARSQKVGSATTSEGSIETVSRCRQGEPSAKAGGRMREMDCQLSLLDWEPGSEERDGCY